MANNPFETRKFQDIEAARIQPTQVAPSAAESPVNIFNAALPGINKLLDLKQDQFKRDLADQTEKDLRSSIVAPSEVFAEEIQEGRNPLQLLGRKERLQHAIAREIGGDVDIEDPRIAEAVSTFERLALAKADGKLLTDRVRTIALAKMKQMINNNPLFADEIRATARLTLGFDPSGADVAEVLNILKPPKKGTGKPKTRKEALRRGYLDFLQKGGASSITQEEWEKGGNKTFQEELQTDNILREAQESKLVAQKGLTFINKKSATIQRDIISQILSDIENGGGLTNPETLAADYVSKMNLAFSELKSLDGTINLRLEDSNALNTAFTNTLNTTRDMISQGSLKTLLDTRVETVKSIMLAELYKDSQLAAIHAVAGGEGLLTFADIMARYPDNPAILNAIRNLGGKFAGLESYGELANGIGDSLIKILSGEPLDDKDVAFGELAAKPMIEDFSSDKHPNTVTGIRNGLGDDIAMQAFDTDKAVLATASNPKQKSAFNNLYLSYAAPRIKGLKRILENNPEISIKFQEVEKRGPVRGRRAQTTMISEFVLSAPKFTRGTGVTVNRPAVGKGEELVEELNLLLSITRRYAPHGLISRFSTAEEFVEETEKLLSGDEEKEDKGNE